MSLKNDEAITNEVREGTFFGTSSGTEIIFWRAATVYWSQAGHGSLKKPYNQLHNRSPLSGATIL